MAASTHGLSDSNLIANFWAKPDTSIEYFVVVTDSMGCESEGPPFVFINVNPLSTQNVNLEQGTVHVQLYPNPATDYFEIICEEEIEEVVIYSITGVKEKEERGNIRKISIDHLGKGIHFVFIKIADQIECVKLIKN